GEHDGDRIPMCGVPAHSAEGYLARLIKAGHRVAIADQVETPEEAKKRGGSKALVARAIIRVVTAGTLTEEALLDSRSANWCVALGEAAGQVAIACADISTGRFEIVESDAERVTAEIARLSPAEVIAAETSPFAELATSLRAKGGFDSGTGEARLKAL